MDPEKFRRIKKLKLPVKPYSLYEGETAIVTGFGYEELKYSKKIPKENPRIISEYTGTSSWRMKFGKATVLSNKNCIMSRKYVKDYLVYNHTICSIMMQHKDGKVEGVIQVFIHKIFKFRMKLCNSIH